MNTHEYHDAYNAMLIEYLDGNLDAEKSAAFVVHLLQCDTCTTEVQTARALEQHFQTVRATSNAFIDTQCEQENFERLWRRIETDENPQRMLIKADTIPPEKIQYRNKIQRKWLLSVSAATAAVLMLTVGVNWFEHARQPDYRTLAQSMPRAACGELHVRFTDNFTAADIEQVLTALPAEIVAGPTAHGVYTLHASQPDNALTRLRLHPAVLLVEPVSC